jgi:hypothetical protein
MHLGWKQPEYSATVETCNKVARMWCASANWRGADGRCFTSVCRPSSFGAESKHLQAAVCWKGLLERSVGKGSSHAQLMHVHLCHCCCPCVALLTFSSTRRCSTNRGSASLTCPFCRQDSVGHGTHMRYNLASVMHWKQALQRRCLPGKTWCYHTRERHPGMHHCKLRLILFVTPHSAGKHRGTLTCSMHTDTVSDSPPAAAWPGC